MTPSRESSAERIQVQTEEKSGKRRSGGGRFESESKHEAVSEGSTMCFGRGNPSRRVRTADGNE